MGDCDILIYSPSNEPNPAHIGGSNNNNTAVTQYYDASGTLWTLNQTITLACGGAGGSEAGNPADSPDLSLGDVTWLLNTFGQGSSGGGGGGSNGGGTSPIQLAMLTDNGVVGYSPIDNFFYSMENEKGITFSFAEKQLIQDNWTTWGWAVNGYVASTGQKPDLSGFTLNISTATNEQVIAAIGKLMDDPGVPKGLTNNELTLLGIGTAQFRANLNKYYEDAKEATQRAIWRYSYAEAQEQGLSRANAFKHALFAILHARSFGRQLAQDLTNSHENYDVNRSPTNYLIEVQMDLWNNQEGFTIYDSNPNRQISEFDDAVFQAVRNGVMRYVVNETLVPTF